MPLGPTVDAQNHPFVSSYKLSLQRSIGIQDGRGNVSSSSMNVLGRNTLTACPHELAGVVRRDQGGADLNIVAILTREGD